VLNLNSMIYQYTINIQKMIVNGTAYSFTRNNVQNPVIKFSCIILKIKTLKESANIKHEAYQIRSSTI